MRHTVGAAYLSGALAYGWQDVTTDRTVTVAGIDRLRAQFNANAFSGRVEGGYRFVSAWIGGIGITPYAAGQFTTFDLPAYAEQVARPAPTPSRWPMAPRASPPSAANSACAPTNPLRCTNAILTLRGRAAWAHDFNPDRAVAATFQTLPGASFVVNGARRRSDSALTTASAEMKWLNGWSARRHLRGRVLRCHPQLRRQGRRALRVVKEGDGAASAVIACDKREAFAQGSAATKQSIYPRAATWIASRSLSSGGATRRPGGSQ